MWPENLSTKVDPKILKKNQQEHEKKFWKKVCGGKKRK